MIPKFHFELNFFPYQTLKLDNWCFFTWKHNITVIGYVFPYKRMHRKGQNEYPKNAIVYYDDENLSKTLSFLKYYFSLLQFAMFHGLLKYVSK